MKWTAVAASVLVAFVALGALVALIGSRLPRDHVASRTLRLRTTPQEVWTTVLAITTASSVPVDVVEQDPPRRLVTRVKDSEKMFGGTWTILITPDASGSQPASSLAITERGWVANPVFRFVSRYVMGHHATIDSVLTQVAATLHEEPVLTGE